MSAQPAEGPASPGEADKKATSKRRASRSRKPGEASAEVEAEKSAEEATAPMEGEQLPEERDEWSRAPGFQRMKTAWSGPDRAHLDRAQAAIAKRIWDLFPEALQIMWDVYDVVRLKEADPNTGEQKVDPFGFPVWQKNSLTGAYIEDWTLLDTRQKEHFIHRIATQIFEWEQKSADLWTEAMFSKAMFTERFAIEFDAPMHGTIEDRTARGNKNAAEDRYFAIMNAAVSRKAEAIVRSMNNLMLRLRDTLGQ